MPQTEIEIFGPEQVPAVPSALGGQRLYPVELIGLATRMRRGEIVALRWSDIDLDGGKVRVERSLEETKAGLAFKEPKTKAGRRTIGIPQSVVAAAHTLAPAARRAAGAASAKPPPAISRSRGRTAAPGRPIGCHQPGPGRSE